MANVKWHEEPGFGMRITFFTYQEMIFYSTYIEATKAGSTILPIKLTCSLLLLQPFKKLLLDARQTDFCHSTQTPLLLNNTFMKMSSGNKIKYILVILVKLFLSYLGYGLIKC